MCGLTGFDDLPKICIRVAAGLPETTSSSSRVRQAGHVLGPEPDEPGGVEVVGDLDHGWPAQAHPNSLLAVLAGNSRGSGRSSTSDESAPMPSAITRSVTSAM
jgi:hypothetical protein